MTLGDIFEKLGRISIRSILKIWGWAALAFLVCATILTAVCLVGALIYLLFLAIPWYLFVFFVFMLGGLMAHGYFNVLEEDFPSEL
jgi:hypothetical protein